MDTIYISRIVASSSNHISPQSFHLNGVFILPAFSAQFKLLRCCALPSSLPKSFVLGAVENPKQNRNHIANLLQHVLAANLMSRLHWRVAIAATVATR